MRPICTPSKLFPCLYRKDDYVVALKDVDFLETSVGVKTNWLYMALLSLGAAIYLALNDKSDLIRALPFEKRVTDAGSGLIGDPFILHLDQLFLKPGGQGIGTNWHQDNAYFKIADPLKGTAMWVAIHDATIANGTIHVVHDSFKEEYPHDRDPNSDHHIHCQVPEERAVPIELEAGSVAFFCYGTAHSTKANTTDRERAGMAFHFLHIDCVDRANLIDRQRGQPFLAGPEASGGEAEYGVKVAGTWESEVARTLT